MKLIYLPLFVACILILTSLSSANIIINEFTTDPQQDWSGNGFITDGTDEWFELYNPTPNPVDLSGWTLYLIDTSPEAESLTGTILPFGYLNVLNPQGVQNNNGQIILYDLLGNQIDSVSYGNWDDGILSDNAPDGNSDSIENECLARIPNSHDTNNDNLDFVKTLCTYNGFNNGDETPFCGDGDLYDFGDLFLEEECDSGVDNGVVCEAAYEGTCEYCSSGCELITITGPFCGDFKTDPPQEQCDDGNNRNNDGCSSSCQNELITIPPSSESGGNSIPGSISIEEFAPIIWQCGNRLLRDDEMQPWRGTGLNDRLLERAGNYLFDGESYEINVVVFDKNKIQDVIVDLILEGGEDLSINCIPNHHFRKFESCNARIDEEEISEFNYDTMRAFTCKFTALSSEYMYGPFMISVQAKETSGNIGSFDEITPLFLNPIISLGIEGDILFDDVRPGTASYSQIIIENQAEGGVLLDMFVAGKNWPSSDPDLGRCLDPTTGELENYLSLGAFRYYAENGAWDTRADAGIDSGYSSVVRDSSDPEGYININQLLNDGFEEAMFNDAEIIQTGGFVIPIVGFRANTLSPGGNMALTFRLDLPEPCYGNFQSAHDGSFFIYGEAI
jgi:cysteine-rich repeat protein